MPYLNMHTLGTSRSLAIVKIIQDSSLPPPLEICEFRFDVNNEQHMHYWAKAYFLSAFVQRYLATPGILSRLWTYVYNISSLWRVITHETNFNFLFWRQNNGHTTSERYLYGIKFVRSLQPGISIICFARYSGLNKWLQSPVEL
jgi:hypothetical protein